jgi:hypothetical protein
MAKLNQSAPKCQVVWLDETKGFSYLEGHRTHNDVVLVRIATDGIV